MYNNQETFYKKNSYTGKHLCWRLLLKMQTFRPATLLKRDSNIDAFLKILKKNF